MDRNDQHTYRGDPDPDGAITPRLIEHLRHHPFVHPDEERMRANVGEGDSDGESARSEAERTELLRAGALLVAPRFNGAGPALPFHEAYAPVA